MSNEDLVAYLQGLDHQVETLDLPGAKWIIVPQYPISTGSLTGQVRDIAILWSTQMPYVPPSAIQVRPHVVPMGTHNAQASPLGGDWQYLSRVLRGQPTPQAWLVHINTIFSEF
jgi:hypothetical protein